MISFEIFDVKKIDEELAAFCGELEGLGLSDDDVFRGRLVSCELLSNALRHGGDRASFLGRVSDGAIEIRVVSETAWPLFSDPVLPDPYAESGRGLYIVRNLCGGDIRVSGREIVVVMKI